MELSPYQSVSFANFFMPLKCKWFPTGKITGLLRHLTLIFKITYIRILYHGRCGSGVLYRCGGGGAKKLTESGMETFEYIKSVIGIILGLSFAKLLQSAVKLIQ